MLSKVSTQLDSSFTFLRRRGDKHSVQCRKLQWHKEKGITKHFQIYNPFGYTFPDIKKTIPLWQWSDMSRGPERLWVLYQWRYLTQTRCLAIWSSWDSFEQEVGLKTSKDPFQPKLFSDSVSCLVPHPSCRHPVASECMTNNYHYKHFLVGGVHFTLSSARRSFRTNKNPQQNKLVSTVSNLVFLRIG